MSIHGVLWTLSIEWLFYGFMLVCAPLSGIRTAAGGSSAGCSSCPGVPHLVWQTYTSNDDLNFYVEAAPGMLDHFACGALAAMAMQFEGVRRFVQRRDVKTVGLAVSAVAVAVAVAMFHRYLPEKLLERLLGHVVHGHPVSRSSSAERSSRVHDLPHAVRDPPGPVHPAVGARAHRRLLVQPLPVPHHGDRGVRRAWRAERRPAGRSRPASILVFVVAAVLLTAFASYFLVEKPFMQMRARYTGTPPRVVAPARGRPRQGASTTRCGSTTSSTPRSATPPPSRPDPSQ